jgi:hypothetical protein
VSQLCFGHPKTLASFIRQLADYEETHADAFVHIEEEDRKWGRKKVIKKAKGGRPTKAIKRNKPLTVKCTTIEKR